jgi:hypothetical protein
MTRRKLRIGILALQSLEFAAWNNRIFEQILGSDAMEVCCLIVDGHQAASKTTLEALRHQLRHGSLLRTILAKMVFTVERYLFLRGEPADGYRSERVERALRALPRHEVRPERRGFVERFSVADCRGLKDFDLDVILCGGFRMIEGPILESARHGIWALHLADTKTGRGGPIGFWEVYDRQPCTGATLYRLTGQVDGGLVIGRGFYSTQRSALRNSRFVGELSVPLLMDALERLAAGQEPELTPSPICFNRPCEAPGSCQLLRYGTLLIGQLVDALRSRSFRYRDPWRLYLGRGNPFGAMLWRAKELLPPKDEFWADPFLIEDEDRLWCFFENYRYAKGKGEISVAEVTEQGLGEVRDALVTDYHLSFPFVFAHQGEIYMIPETAEVARIEVWRATQFPTQWERFATALEGRSVADTVLYQDQDGTWWMFSNLSRDALGDHCSELHLFRVDGPALRAVEPHPLNPVVRDCRSARNGGRVFRRSGELYRIAQRNIHGIYGYGFSVQRIDRLSMADYAETTVDWVEPNFDAGLVASHHLDAAGGFYVVDGRKKPSFRR